jgi:hypothetical protein
MSSSCDAYPSLYIYIYIYISLSHIISCVYNFKYHYIVYRALILQNQIIIIAKNSNKQNKN